MSEDRTAQARQIPENLTMLDEGFAALDEAIERTLARLDAKDAQIAALTAASAAKDEEIARLRKAIEAVLDDDVMTDRLYGSPLADMLRAALKESR